MSIIFCCCHRSSGGLASILKDSGEVKFNKDEQSLTCCILCTADYSLETTQQVNKVLIIFIAHDKGNKQNDTFIISDRGIPTSY